MYFWGIPAFLLELGKWCPHCYWVPRILDSWNYLSLLPPGPSFFLAHFLKESLTVRWVESGSAILSLHLKETQSANAYLVCHCTSGLFFYSTYTQFLWVKLKRKSLSSKSLSLALIWFILLWIFLKAILTGWGGTDVNN